MLEEQGWFCMYVVRVVMTIKYCSTVECIVTGFCMPNVEYVEELDNLCRFVPMFLCKTVFLGTLAGSNSCCWSRSAFGGLPENRKRQREGSGSWCSQSSGCE